MGSTEDFCNLYSATFAVVWSWSEVLSRAGTDVRGLLKSTPAG